MSTKVRERERERQREGGRELNWCSKIIMKGNIFGWLVFMVQMLQGNVWIFGDV